MADDRLLNAHPYVRTLDDRLRALGASDSNPASAAALLRAAAQQSIDRLRAHCDNGERLHTIVARCDLGGEMHKVVAADLGISRRQFYRDLAFARNTIDQDVRDGMLREVPHATGTTPQDARLQTALALVANGHAKAAVDYFAPVVETLRGDEAMWGRSLLADLMLDAGDVKSAKRELRRAFALGDDPHGAGMAHALLTQAKILQQTDKVSEASVLLERLIPRLESSAAANVPLLVDTLSASMSLLAFCHHERGYFAAASAVNAGNPASSAGAAVSLGSRRQYLNVDATLACDGSDGPAAAQPAWNAFYQFAVAHGFVDDVSCALLQMGSIARFERRFEDAERLARESLAIERAIGFGGAPVLGMLAGIAVDRGDYERAVRLACEARDRARIGSRTWWAAHLHEAEAFTHWGRHAQARAACASVARDADSGDVRIQAWIQRVEAMVFEGLGDERRAYRAARSSLEILGADAPPFQRIKGLLAAEHIRPSREHRAQIRTLASVLGWRRAASD
ncbi:MAG TPA: tetratricopeptide repeat protein [Candidatus Tumulicola sp.]